MFWNKRHKEQQLNDKQFELDMQRGRLLLARAMAESLTGERKAEALERIMEAEKQLDEKEEGTQ